MTLEVLILCSLIFVFIISFCGLLQKIKQSYERERIIAVRFYAERLAHRHDPRDGSSDAYINSTFIEDLESTDRDVGIFPSAPPPYAPLEAPPKYEDIIKEEENNMRSVSVQTRINVHTPTTPAQPPPPYTIST
ncbi:uncharacterized protein LOC130448193 isoform X2 [Diorhabda sublineata]|uniref:uncharacterized protein LOC130448193 isoform X2 n=1 Tax=Diorhabda sublineata TaxID=1163346 RepID=UPI0024E07FB9|nr:uncharacterized protein LOC130448193 isoform X2 [Diorhabda sublineata]